MALLRNEDFFLYTGLCVDNGDCYNALIHLRTLEQSGFRFKHLHYGEPSQHEDLMRSLKTWGPNLDDLAFPFVTYTEVYDFNDPRHRPAAFVKGLQGIQDADWLALYNYDGRQSNTSNTQPTDGQANTEASNTVAANT